MKQKKIFPPTYGLLSMLMMIGLRFLAPIAQIIPTPWTLSGTMLIGLGLTINVMASNAFTRHKTTIKPDEEPTTLVTDGWFRLSRNPMYLGAVLLLSGVAIILGSLSPFVVIPVFFFLMNGLFIKKEEKILEATLGEAYLAYKQQVRRWL